MTVRPQPVPPTAPAPRPSDGPTRPARPWWARMWIPLTVVLVLLLPPITLWSAGAFDPDLPPPKEYTPGAAGPTGATAAVMWAALAVPVLVAGMLLAKRWPVVLVVVLLAYVWTWIRQMVIVPTTDVELLGNAVAMTVIGLVVGGIGQIVYNMVGKK